MLDACNDANYYDCKSSHSLPAIYTWEHKERSSASRRSSSGYDTEAPGVFLLLMLLLGLGLLGAFKILTMLPGWALISIAVLLGIVFLVVGAKIAIGFVRAFLHRPLRTSIYALLLAGAIFWAGMQVHRAFSHLVELPHSAVSSGARTSSASA